MIIHPAITTLISGGKHSKADRRKAYPLKKYDNRQLN
jgi:hypothetical protein